METTIQFVKGSHRWDRWFRPRKFETNLNYKVDKPHVKDKRWEEMLDIDAHPDDYEILQWAVQVM